MSVQRGTLLGPYEIVTPIGAGGMGEDVLSDGTFVIGKRSLNPDSPPLTVIVNWTNLLP